MIGWMLLLPLATVGQSTGQAAGQATGTDTPPKAPPPRVQDLATPPRVTLPAGANPEIRIDQPLTADEVAQIALAHQPSVEAARGNLLSAQGRTRQVRSGLYPQIAAVGGYDHVGSLSGNGVKPSQAPSGLVLTGASPVYQVASALQIRQLIYDFNQTRNLVRQSRAQEAAASGLLSQTQSNLVYSVKSAFYTYVANEQLVQVNEQNLANRQRQLDLATARIRQGIGLPSDVVTAETSKSQAILALNVARDNAEQARVNLLTQMGVDPLTPIRVEGATEPAYAGDDPRPLIETALRRRPEVRIAQANLAASRYGLGAARATNAPTLYAGATAGTRGADFPLNDSTYSLQLGLQIPLSDGGMRSGAIEQSRGQVATAEAQLQSATLQVKNDVAAAYLALKSAEQKVVIAENEVANAREGVRIAEGRYRTGLGSFLDITTAQGLLLNALTDQTQAQSALNVARTRIRYATGERVGG